MNEFALIDVFTAQFDVAPPPRGPGDDCAVLPPTRTATCVTTDAVVEGVHFTRADFSLEDVGHKALAVNLSDLASMGAVPAWAVCALGLPAGISAAEVRALGRGMAALARAHRVELVGGNVTASAELSVTLTLGGLLPRGARPMLRSGAKAGDELYVSGPLGDAAAGVEVLAWRRREARGAGVEVLARRRLEARAAGVEVGRRRLEARGAGVEALARHGREARAAGIEAPARHRRGARASGPHRPPALFAPSLEPLVRAQRRPTPHVALGLAAAPFASACIDVSDGLVQDLGHVCAASQVGAELSSAALPVSPALLDFAGTREAALPWALAGGEDYVLLLAVPRARAAAFHRALARAGYAPTRVGRVIAGRGVRVDARPFHGRAGFRHFR